MEIIDRMVDAMAELLIENMKMREILDGMGIEYRNLLDEAKADPKRRRFVQDYLAPLRSAISNEVDIERMIQEMMKVASETKH